MSSSQPAARTWTVIVPVKLITLAKTRLSPLGGSARQRLALAFALDTVTAALQCAQVARAVVVTNDPTADRFRELGADVVPDVPDAGLNPALVYAGQHVRAHDHRASLAALSSDLPSVRPDDLTAAIEAAPASPWFVGDAHGVGTTMLAAPDGSPWQPRFGHHSRAWHQSLGLTEIAATGLERLRRDVDTTVDLWDARRLGVGKHTAAALAEIGDLRDGGEKVG